MEPESINRSHQRRPSADALSGGAQLAYGFEVREREISSGCISLRLSEVVVEPAPIVKTLEVHVSHPKLPGHARIFDLSPFLHEGYRRSPCTIRQIVDPALSPESRLDAIRTLVVDICKISGRVPAAREFPSRHTSHDEVVDELEPSFEIRGELLTELGDVVRGYSRRCVVALRNNKPLVQFLLIEQEGVLRHASIILHPAQIEWPLLDRDGRYVTERTVDGAIHDLTHHLRQVRSAPTSRVMESLAKEVRARVSRNEDAPDLLRGRRFVQEAWAAYRDERGVSVDFGLPPLSPMLAPSEHAYIPRHLPDGRACWVYHDIQNGRTDVLRLAGYSRSGARFSVHVQYSSHMSWRVGAICEDLALSNGWPDLNPALALLRNSKRGGISFSYSTSPDSYPAAVNALIDSVRLICPHSEIGLGLWKDRDGRMEPYLSDIIGEFIKGRLPLHGSVGGKDPAHTWVFHAMLDDDLHGSVIFVNSLRGSLIMRSLQGADMAARGRALTHAFKELFESPELFLGSFHGKSAFDVTLFNLPHGGATERFSRVNDFALAMWNGARSAGHFAYSESSGYAPWRACKGELGQWVVSLESIHSVREALPYVVACVVSERGVREVLVSYGARDPLGGLWGRRITAETGDTLFDESEVETLVRVLSDGSSLVREESLTQRVQSVVPRAQVSLPRSMRAIDPEAARKDLLPRFVKWLKNLW